MTVDNGYYKYVLTLWTINNALKLYPNKFKRRYGA